MRRLSEAPRAVRLAFSRGPLLADDHACFTPAARPCRWSVASGSRVAAAGWPTRPGQTAASRQPARLHPEPFRFSGSLLFLSHGRLDARGSRTGLFRVPAFQISKSQNLKSRTRLSPLASRLPLPVSRISYPVSRIRISPPASYRPPFSRAGFQKTRSGRRGWGGGFSSKK